MITNIVLVISAFSLIFLGYLMRRNIVRKKRQLRIPDGRITYSDLNIPGKILFSKKFRISGKPDYIIKNNNSFIPVEVKSGSSQQPQKNHVFQLVTYCQLVEENYRDFTPYGIIVYKDSDFKIPFNPSLRFELENVIKKMRRELKSNEIKLNHNDPRKCRNCSMRIYCNYKLV
jgi:CRISPR-associated exonuclease Cas4